MPAYDFKCRGCSGLVFETRTSEPGTCPVGHTDIERLWDFRGLNGRAWEGGYSPTLGRYASNPYAVSEGLKEASERTSEEMGMEHRYVPCDPRDLPTTDE